MVSNKIQPPQKIILPVLVVLLMMLVPFNNRKAYAVTDTPTAIITSAATMTPTATGIYNNSTLNATVLCGSEYVDATHAQTCVASGSCLWDDAKKILTCTGTWTAQDTYPNKIQYIHPFVILKGTNMSSGMSIWWRNAISSSGNFNVFNYCVDGTGDFGRVGSRKWGGGSLCFRQSTANTPASWIGSLSGSFMFEFGLYPTYLTPSPTLTPTPMATSTSIPTATFTPTVTATPLPSSGYNRPAAVAYADQWAHEPRNTNYPNYGVDADGNDCVDCTNYLSQVLEAGGIPQIPGDNDVFHWYTYQNIFGVWLGSGSWAATDLFNTHAFQYPARYEYYPSGPSNLSEGDFFLMDLATNPFVGPDHARVVIGIGTVLEGDNIGETMLLVNQHCIDRQRIWWGYKLPAGTPLWAWHVVY